MIPKLSFAIWTAIAPSLGNHLWQSTLFASAIALLTLTLRNNRAQVRYWLWLAASLKFLIPFSLLVGLGSHLTSPRATTAPITGLYFAMEQVGQPFTQQAVPSIPNTIASSTFHSLIQLLPALLVVWLCGFVVVLFVWCVRWRRISAAVREAEPLRRGREVEVLRRLESAPGMPKKVEIRSSRGSLEPGVFGIARPVLLWPHGITGRLEDEHLKSILVHELLHIRRHDNLAAAIHMLVEAVFWFHPMIWWMGTRLVEERERACDEQVLESGGDRQVYAESILKICEFCVGSPLTCVSGVTGAELKTRITRIMSGQVARKLDVRRKLLLAAAFILAVAAPIVAGMLHANARRAESQTQNTTVALPNHTTVSIAPSSSNGGNVTLMFGPAGFVSKNSSLQQVIRVAYGVEDDRIVGAPTWLGSDKYDVELREDNSAMNDPRQISPEQRASEQGVMLQSVLADRLKLSLHREAREVSAYALVLAKSGPRLQQSKPGDTYPNGFKGPDGVARPGGIHFAANNTLIAQGVPIGPLRAHLSWQLRRTILDETGLSGTYDFTLQLPNGVPLGIDNPTPPESYELALSTAIEQQLGLQLEPRKASMEVLVIDHVEKPELQSEAARSKLAFNSAVVTPNKSTTQDVSMNVTPSSGLLSGTNARLISYIYFAYNITGNQFQLLMPRLPKWLINDHFDIQARADGNPSKDQMRLMMQSLLADRFKLAIHYETHRLPVFGLVLAKPGRTGPQLQPHPEDSTCSTPLSQPSTGVASAPTAIVAGGLPTVCGSIEGMPSTPSGRLRAGARGVPIGLLASTLGQMGNLDRAVLDRTGLSGNFDFTFEWSPQFHGPGTPQEVLPVAANAQSGQAGPTFQQELQEQLGLKLEPQEGPVEVLVIDHIEKLTEN
jgi:bla regulator protein BlaR1